MDRFDRATRSRVMSRSRSHGTKSTERRFRAMLAGSGVKGWALGHGRDLPGRPDFIFEAERLVVFVDGCFWHGCARCRDIPRSNRKFWAAKIRLNRLRDRRVERLLRGRGWSVLRIWEHDLALGGSKALLRVRKAILRRNQKRA